MAQQERKSRAFQREVLALLQKGENIILQAPTGAGKTDAALQPYVQCLEQNEQWLPRTCLYATPMRVLTNQFYQKYAANLLALDKKRGLTEVYEKLKLDPVSIQTGEQPNDPQLEALLTFCTIDQLLASFLGIPYSMDSRRANLNVGAVIGSYLVLDEFHLYPLLEHEGTIMGARTTVLTMLRLLAQVTRFVLMTATFSTALVQELAQLLNAKVVTVSDDHELAEIADGRRRTFEVAASSMDAQTILAQHQRCTLVICNTVQRAQQRYWELKASTRDSDIEVLLLHSRLTASDRTGRSDEITRELGPAPKEWDGEIPPHGWYAGRYYGKNLIVVATQVVEVGLDISVETLHTELAPANSLIQRAGRCARFAKQEGRVLIYELPADADGKAASTLPYRKETCEQTLQQLRLLDPQQTIGFREERALIDAVHTQEDTQLLANYKRQDVIEKKIFASLAANERGVGSTLIRDVAQVQILIHDDPNGDKDAARAIREEPWRWQSFALHPGSLASRMQTLAEHAEALQLDWFCRQAVLQTDEKDDEADSKQKVRYRWDVVPLSKNTSVLTKTLASSLMLVLHPQIATYHDELGFVLLDGTLPVEVTSTGYQSAPPDDLGKSDKKGGKGYSIKMQSYQEHIYGLLRAYVYDGSIQANTHYVATRLEDLMGLPTGAIDHAIRLAIACHDLGKLSQAWQQWAWEWQTLRYQKHGPAGASLPEEPFFFAKTDNTFSQEERDWQKKLKRKRAHHACEGVVIGIDLLADSLGVESAESPLLPVLRATCAAIARHHTPQASHYNDVVLAQGAQEAAREALELVRQNMPWRYDLSLLDTHTIKQGDLAPDSHRALFTLPTLGRQHELETWLYFVIVRALRLADQRTGIRW